MQAVSIEGICLQYFVKRKMTTRASTAQNGASIHYDVDEAV